MKKYILKSTIIALSLVTIVACKKEKEHEEEHEDEHTVTPATINVTTLNNGDTIQAAAMMHISGTITAANEMHGYQLIIHNHATMTDVHTVENHDHTSTYSFDEHWTNNVTDTSMMMLKITAVLDHDGNETQKVINFVCLP